MLVTCKISQLATSGLDTGTVWVKGVKTFALRPLHHIQSSSTVLNFVKAIQCKPLTLFMRSDCNPVFTLAKRCTAVYLILVIYNLLINKHKA